MIDFVIFANRAIYGIGWAVCILGGLGIGAIIATWTIDKVLTATKITNIVAQWWLEKKFPSASKANHHHRLDR